MMKCFTSDFDIPCSIFDIRATRHWLPSVSQKPPQVLPSSEMRALSTSLREVMCLRLCRFGKGDHSISEQPRSVTPRRTDLP